MSYTNLLIHIVFATKDRRPYLRGEVRPAAHAYLIGILKNLKAYPIALNGVEDHVHMLVDLSASTSIADLLRTIKTNSSKWIHENYSGTKDFAWQTKYGAFSVSSSNKSQFAGISRVRRNIIGRERSRKSFGIFSKNTAWNSTSVICGNDLLVPVPPLRGSTRIWGNETQGSRPGLTECRAFGA